MDDFQYTSLNPNPLTSNSPQGLPSKPPKPKRYYGVIIMVSLLFIVAAGLGGYFYAKSVSEAEYKDKLAQAMSVPSPTPLPSATPVPTASVSANLTYEYENFSVDYPKTWKVFDDATRDASESAIITNEKLNLFDREVILQKGNYMLFVGIKKAQDGTIGGGFFQTPTEEYTWQATGDLIEIDTTPFNLLKVHTSFEDFNALPDGAGVYGAGVASLSEYVPNKSVEGYTESFPGYEENINKNGYDYVIVKFSNNSVGSGMTPVFIQREMIEILESIKW